LLRRRSKQYGLTQCGSLCREDEEVEELKAKLRTHFGRRGCDGERARARQSERWQWWLGSPLGENERRLIGMRR
jgi:hypothetical protein